VRVAVFGGTGKTGWLTVHYAVDSGYGCKVLTRNPERMPAVPGVEYVEGSSINGGRVMLTLAGCDAVVVALKGDKKAPKGFLTTSLSHIVSGMRKLEIPRLVVIGYIGAGGSASQLPSAQRLFGRLSGKRDLEDLASMEEMVKGSSLDWTFVKTGTLTDQDASGAPAVGSDTGTTVKPVSREDVAQFVVGEIEGRTYVQQTPYIGGSIDRSRD
jgi:putative NADH-flavin reductase